MKIEKELMVLCDHALISNNGKLNIIGIFEQMHVKKFPGGVARAYLVASMKTEPNEKHQYEARLLDEKGENIMKPTTLEAVSGSNGKHNLVIELLNLIFPKSGLYKFALFTNNVKVASTSLLVTGGQSDVQSKQKSN